MKNNLIEHIKTYITDHHLIQPDSTIIVGLSGGPDSVFLLHLLNQLYKDETIKLIAAHLDHEWREDSSKDEQFCRTMCKRLGVPFVSQKISELKNLGKFEGSKEEYGRRARRQFLKSLAKEYHANAIALAHHAQDQQETFFIRLLRGASLAGLTSMKPKQDDYIRPLLEVNKQDILTYLDKNHIPYIKDPSNESLEFLRNRIRATVIPAIKECDTRFDHNFARTLQRLQTTEDFLSEVTKKTRNNISTQVKDKTILSITQLLALHPALRYRVLLDWFIQENIQFPVSETFFDEVFRFLQQPGSKEHQLHSDWKLVKKQDQVWIEKTQ